MRNLKKVFAVILTVALLATSLMVPALAAVSNEAEALKLQKIGLFAGNPEDLKLDEGVTRIQGLAFAIRAAGKEKEAFAMTDEEVAAELAKFTDSSAIPAWGVKYAAYAIKNGITVGVGNNKFAALDPISGTSFLVFLMKSGMGYADVTTANVIDVAVEAKVLTAGQAVTYASKAALIRDDAAAILYGAAKNGVNANGKTFIQSLIDAGFVTKEAAVEAGFVAAEPEKFEVVSVKADNLVRVQVTFNKKVDKDSIDNGDFEVDGTSVASSDVSLSDDKLVATLTIPVSTVPALSNGDETTIEISGIKDTDGNDVTEYVSEFVPYDDDPPVVESIEFTGPETAKVTFSEPINEGVGSPEIIIDGGIYSAAPATGYDNKDTVTVNLGTELDEGSHAFKIKGFEDFAGYSNLVATLDVDYEAIDTAPSVSVKEATQSYVILQFERPVTDVEVDDFYQTYSNWKPLEVQKEDKTALTSSEYVDVVRLAFTDAECITPTGNDDNDNPLPVGNAKIVVKDEAVEDHWGNKIDGDVVLTASITADTTKPEITKISVEAENKLHVYFSEDVVAADAEDDANYVIKDKDGKVISSSRWNAENYNSTDKYVEINFVNNLDNGEYTLTAEAIADKSISANTLDTVTLTFTITDKTAVITGVQADWVNADKVLYVKYPDTMDPASVLNKDNYRLGATTESAVKLADSVKLTMFTSKIVKMQFASTTTDLVNQKLIIGVVKDAAGNTVNALATVVNITAESAPAITAVKKIAENKFELKVDQELKSIAAGAISVDANGSGDPKVASYKYVNDGSNTKITITVPDTEKSAGTEAVTLTYQIIIDGDKIKSVTGASMVDVIITAGGALGNFADGVAPKLAETTSGDAIVFAYDSDGDNLIDNIILKYSEDIAAATVSKYTYSVDGYTVKSAVVVNAGNMAAVRTAIDTNSLSSILGNGKYVVITINELDDGTLDDTDATPEVTQKYSIEDVAGNELAPQEGVEALSAQEADLLNP